MLASAAFVIRMWGGQENCLKLVMARKSNERRSAFSIPISILGFPIESNRLIEMFGALMYIMLFDHGMCCEY